MRVSRTDGDGKPDGRLTSKGRALAEAALSPSVAHEINNPLDSLLNLLYLLEDEGIMSEKGRRYLTLAREEVHRIGQIANRSLDQHKVLAISQRTNVAELLASVLDFYKQKFERSGITVQTRCSSDLNIRVYAEQLRQVFSNLLLNAVDAMPQGGKIQARVYAGHEWSGQRRRGVRVTIADNGSGIAPSILPLIFQRRFTTKSAGHGIGLLMVTDIVQKHRGALRVRSSTQPGRRGTVFALFLPAGQ